MATYKDMFKRVSRAAGFLSTDAAFSNGSDITATVKELINESNKLNAALAPLRPKTYEISLTAGTNGYELPADFQLMRYVHYLQGTRKIEIFPIQEEGFLTLESVVSNSTLFIHYTVRFDESAGAQTKKLWLFPIPGQNGQKVYIDYLAGPSELNTDPTATTDQNTNLFAAPQFDSVDKAYCLWKIKAQLEMWTDADRYKADYLEAFQRMKDFVGRRNESIVVKKGIKTQMNPNLYPTLTN